jgi:uncharacterized repeat protein (TIGR01451 family)
MSLMNNDSAVKLIYGQLGAFVKLDNFWDLFEIAFGKEYDQAAALRLKSQWEVGDFSQFPDLEVISSSILGEANGAYAISTNKIYLSDAYVNGATTDALVSTLLKEYGHFVDAQINQVDSPSDEGTIFSALVGGELLNLFQLAPLKTQDNSLTVLESIMPSSSELLGGYSDPLLDDLFIPLSDTSAEASPTQNPSPLFDAVEISSDKNIIGIGENHQVTYTFKITNKTSEDATNVSVKVTIPKGINIISTSVPETIVNRQIDSEGNTILTVGTGSVLKNSSVSGTLTVEATGFSQPLENLQDYLWNFKITSSASGTFPNVSNVEYTSNTAVISTQVDSSKGIAEELVKSFLFGSASNQPSSLKNLNTSQKLTSSDTGDPNPKQTEEGIVQIAEEFIDDTTKVATSSLGKPLQTAQDASTELLEAFIEFDLKKAEAAANDFQNTEEQINQIPDKIRQGSEEAGVAAITKGVELLVDSADLAVIAGMYQSLKSTIPDGLTYENGSVNYEKETSTDKFSLGVKVGEFKNVTQAILESVQAHNTAPIKSWADSTANDFATQASYSKTLPNGQFDLKAGYTNATKTLSYGANASLSLGNGFNFGGKVEGQFGQGQSLPSFSLEVTSQLKNSPKTLKALSVLQQC